MHIPTSDPELADRLSHREESDTGPTAEFTPPYTVDGWRNELWLRDRRIAQLRNRIRLVAGLVPKFDKKQIVAELETILKEV